MNIPEFLLRCASSPADLWENGDVPETLSSPSSLANAFINSMSGQLLLNDIEGQRSLGTYSSRADDNEREALDNAFSQNGSVPDLKEFAKPTLQQIQLLLGRGWKLVRRNPANLLRTVSAIVRVELSDIAIFSIDIYHVLTLQQFYMSRRSLEYLLGHCS